MTIPLPDLFICAHRVMDPPVGPAIDLFSRLPGTKLSHKWVMSGPATHIFLVVRHADGVAWRHDGQPPRSVWSPDGRRGEEVRWRLLLPPDAHQAALTKARELTGTPYDLGEIVNAAITAATGLHGPPDLFPQALICSSLGSRVLEAADGDPARFVRVLPNHFPEMLAQRLRDEEGSWWLARDDTV